MTTPATWRAQALMIASVVASALVLALALGGCTPAPLIRPLAPATLGQHIEQRQQVTIEYRGQTHSLQVALKVSPAELTMIGLSPIGQRLFTLSWDGGQAEVTSPLAGARRLPARQILADLQLANWPLQVLRDALTDPAMRLEQRSDLRTLWRGDTLLWLAYRNGSQDGDQAGDNHRQAPTMIYNAQAHYRLIVQPLALNGLP